MPRRNVLVLITIIIIFVLAALVVFPVNQGVLGKKGVRLGLDLVGGIHLVYQVQFPAGVGELDKNKDMDRAIATIQSRIDKYGVVEPVIQKQGSDRILIQLPGFTDLEEAKKLAEQTGFLEFREVELDKDGKPVYLRDYLNSDKPDFFNKKEAGSREFVNGETGNPIVFLNKDKDGVLKYVDEGGKPVDVDKLRQGSTNLPSWISGRGDDGIQLTGSFLTKAEANVNTSAKGAEASIGIEWNAQGATIFDQIARRLYNAGPYGTVQRALGIFLDNRMISSPQILEQSYGGKGSITGNFTLDEAEKLANLLQSGALPVALQKPPLYQGKVTPTLGADFIDRSVKAGLIGLLIIMLFMIVYYRLPGVLASLALIFYAVIILALFKLWPGGGVTLTLAGLGGFILSLGMAVDANVLIFERMKEELWTGRTLGAAIDAGFDRAWSAIRDSNLTTFIACGILYWLGKNVVASGPVMGFALTLFIGVAVSMFTAITVTRTFLHLFVGTNLAQKTSLFSAFKR